MRSEDILMGFCGEHGEVATKCKINCKDIDGLRKMNDDQWKEINGLKAMIVGRPLFFAVIGLITAMLSMLMGLTYYMNDRVLDEMVPLVTRTAVIENSVDNISAHTKALTENQIKIREIIGRLESHNEIP